MSDDREHVTNVTRVDHVDTAEHVDTVNTLTITATAAPPAPKTKDERAVRRMQYGVAALLLLAVLAAMLTAGYVLVSRNKGLDTVNSTLRETKAQLTVVQTQLAAAKAQLDQFNNQNNDEKDCSDQLSRNITAANQADIHGLIQVLFVLGSPDDDPTHPRAQRFTDALKVSQAADDAYGTAVMVRDRWVADKSPLPCPVAVSS